MTPGPVAAPGPRDQADSSFSSSSDSSLSSGSSGGAGTKSSPSSGSAPLVARGHGRGRGPPRDAVPAVGRRSPSSSSSSSSLSPEHTATPATGPVAVTRSIWSFWRRSEEAEEATAA
jgi:hypothetical protein